MSFLAIDLGASSGRAVIGTLDGDVMRMEEIHRFRTPMVERGAHLCWDIDAMWREVQSAVAMTFARGEPLQSISVDSWAVDYVPLDADGQVIRLPYSYRDPRTAGRLETAIRRAGGTVALYDRTGIQFLEFNTLPQIVADLADEPELVSRTATRLLIAEYFLYRLSGARVAEATMASTTQLVDARTGEWSEPLIAAIGDDARRWPPIVACGTVLGSLRAELVPENVSESPLVIATCAHDTAAAVAAVPASSNRSWAFISSGTWSLVGVELEAPVLTREAREAGFTNETGIDGTVRFLTNRAGMWVLEECRREWESRGDTWSHRDLFGVASASPTPQGTVDLNAPVFAQRGGMTQALSAACVAADIIAPATHGETVRVILESIAASHATALRQLESVIHRRIDDVHIVGGGSMNDDLNQLTADRSGRRVLAGPDEATVLGNLLVQARTLGRLPAGISVRDAARRSSRIREFTPREPLSA